MVRKQDGIIAMITTIMVSILLITLAIGLIVLTSGGLQQSSDDELSLRAYAAAEGGIEWAYQAILFNPGTWPNGCISPVLLPAILPPSNQNSITCLSVDGDADRVAGTLNSSNENQVVIAPNGAQTLQKIQVNWITSGDPGYGTAGNANFPAAAPSTWLPGVELTLVNYATNPAGPTNNISGGPGYRIRNVAFLPSKTASPNEPEILAGCTPNAAQFDCSATISADSSNPGGLVADEGELIYIRSLYTSNAQSFNYSICLEDTNYAGTHQCMPVPQTATIDVTARSGPVYRRIVATAPTGGGFVPSALDYVLFGDQDICKDFGVYQAPGAQVQPGVCTP